MTNDSRVRVAQDLRAIIDMAVALGDRATDLGGSPDMPGGDAMLTLAPIANLEAWEWQQGTSERTGRLYTSVADEDPDKAWPCFQLLQFWSEQWRRELGMEYDVRRTVTTEAQFLANPDVLAWAWDNELGWDDFARDVAAARTKIENVVRAGVRTTQSRIRCDRAHSDDKPHRRLNVTFGKDGEPDGYISPCCHSRYTRDEATRAHARQMRQDGAERWITTTEAIGVLATQGWQRRTVRRWIEPLRRRDRCTVCGRSWPEREYAVCPNKIYDKGNDEMVDCGGELEPVWRGNGDEVPESYCDVPTRRTFVWWPTLWRKHLQARHEREMRERVGA